MNIMDFPLSLDFCDIGIRQEKNICNSRLDVDIKSEIARDGMYLNCPLIASNMSSVTDSSFAISLYKCGALGILHRAQDTETYIEEVKKVYNECDIVAASIGSQSDQFDLCKQLVISGANFIVIDVAHGYSDAVINLGRKIKKEFKDIKLAVGNVTNVNFLNEVDDFADVVKCGIGSGFACSTKNTAGAHEKQASVLFNFKQRANELGQKFWSDGGIRESADFVKAIGLGSSAVMAGSIFAKCPNSAGDVIEINGVLKKCYFGMASRRSQLNWKKQVKPGTCVEGKTIYLDIGESEENLIERYSGALKSGITYAGANNIKTFQERVHFVRYK